MRTMLVPVLLLTSVIHSFAGTPGPPAVSLDAEWQRFGRGPRPEPGHVDELDDGLGDALWTAAKSHRSLTDACGSIAKEFGLERDTAAELVEATLVTRTFADSDAETKPAIQVERAVSALWRAYEREPRAGIVLQQAGWILSELYGDPVQERRLLAELKRSNDAAPLVARIAWLGVCSDDTRRAAVAIALEHRADEPALLLAASGLNDDDPCVSGAWARLALKSAEGAEPVDSAFLAAARNRLLASLLRTGQFREALDALAGLSIDQIDSAVGTGSTRAHGTAAGLDFEVNVTAVRAAVASAAFLLGESEIARQTANHVTPHPAPDADDVQKERDRVELVRLAIDRLSTGTPPDSFDVLERAVVGDDSWSDRRLLPTTLVFAQLARASTYPDITVDLLTSEERYPAQHDAAPARIAAQVAACRVRALQSNDALARQLSAEAAAVAADDSASAIITHRLAAAPLNVFSEKQLPASVTPWDPSKAERERLEKSFEKWNLPGFWPVRVEVDGTTVIAIGLSQDYDPAGEVSGGGYWIVRSKDAGKTWGRGLYTGLRPMQPYVIRSFSHLPLASGDRLRIEVDVRELDTDKITFPPIERSFKRERSGLFLDVAWADLERDSDADGLTDLAEERLMTDPQAKDSDGDGLPDGVDPLPQIPASGRASARTQAIAPVLRDAADKSARPIFTGDPGGQGTASPGLDDMRTLAAPLTSEATMFLVADRQAFAGLSLGRRIVVLTAEESELAQKRFGAHYPGTFRLYVDHAGTRGLAIWNESWRGMTIQLRNEGGVWRGTMMSSWIT